MIFHARARTGRDEHEALALQQHERLRDEVRAPLPRSGTGRGDLARADGLAVVLVLDVSQGGEDDALLGGHGLANLVPRVDTRNQTPSQPVGSVGLTAPIAPRESRSRGAAAQRPSAARAPIAREKGDSRG